MSISNKGKIYVVSAPSGAGKTTIVRKLLSEDKNLVESVSYTTRPMRDGEVDGIDYNFVTRLRFKAMIDAGAFIEYFEVFGNYYGTAKDAVNAIINAGNNAVLILDYQGAYALKNIWPNDTKTIFVLPPTLDTLKSRLLSRDTDSTETIDARLKQAHHEIRQSVNFDFCVVNDVLETAVKEVQKYIYSNPDALNPLTTSY